MVLLVCTAVCVLSAAFMMNACSVYASDAPMAVEMVAWMALTGTAPELTGTASLELEFSDPVTGLSANQFSFIYIDNENEVQPNEIAVESIVINPLLANQWTLKLNNVPEAFSGQVQISIDRANIKPASRKWNLDGTPVSAAIPVIAVQPRSGIYGVGEPLTVTALTSDEDGELSYQWFRVDSEIAEGGILVEGEGTDTACWTQNLAAGSTAFYYVVVTNSVPRAESKSKASAAVAIEVKSLKDRIIQSRGARTTLVLYANEELVSTMEFNIKDKRDITLVGGYNGVNDAERVLQVTGGRSGALFMIESDSVLTLGNNVTLKGRTLIDNDTGVLVWVAGGKLLMEDGSKITGNENLETLGSGVRLTKGGSFAMRGGVITGNFASNGGGVGIVDGTFQLESGEISGNRSQISGGGVFVQRGTFKMDDGIISGNTAVYGGGGGVYISSQTNCRKTGGIIYGNNDQSTANITIGGYGHALWYTSEHYWDEDMDISFALDIVDGSGAQDEDFEEDSDEGGGQ
jgi:hypothetical protein